jgi:molybdenum-dependent DNA-binding transcriptional regulator ModE
MNVTFVNAGVATASGGVPDGPTQVDTTEAFLIDQVERMELKVEKARANLEGALSALSDARSQLLAFTGVSDG